MAARKTIELTLWGIVQGVGFRPFLVKLARNYRLTGWIRNEGGRVRARLSGETTDLDAFLERLDYEKPLPAEIVRRNILDCPYEFFEKLSIEESAAGDGGLVMLPADLAVCPDCLNELADAKNPRYRHPFISCMVCGPRYSLIDRVPYDRSNTAMDDFPMCTLCAGEYQDVENRRYHAQTISCHACGPYLEYASPDGDTATMVGEAALRQTVADLAAGKIVALKGIGGYHLACRTDDEAAARALRLMKGRENKPFAVMYRNLAEIREWCRVSAEEADILGGKEKPIVLLDRVKAFSHDGILRGSRQIGAFLPYTPLQALILSAISPLVMTSANRSDEPIITDNAAMRRFMAQAGKAEGLSVAAIGSVLQNERDIRIGEDDSVVRVYGGKPRMIRRARGYVPLPIFLPGLAAAADRADTCEEALPQVFAAGAFLKNTFCLTKQVFAYVSQYHGDMGDIATLDFYKRSLGRFIELLRFTPSAVAVDPHPNYPTTRIGHTMAREGGLPVIPVQHHHAHIASVMAEHGLSEPVLGVAFDGTGYGEDGTIWGGEFLLCTGDRAERLGSLEPIQLLGGDQAARAVWQCAASYGVHIGCDYRHPQIATVKKAIQAGVNLSQTTSTGRLFDAVSAWLELGESAEYEGAAAIRLENAAWEYLDDQAGAGAKKKPAEFKTGEPADGIIGETADYRIAETEKGAVGETADYRIAEAEKDAVGETAGEAISMILSFTPLLTALALAVERVDRVNGSLPPNFVRRWAWRFHRAVATGTVDMCRRIRTERGCRTVALSGGVFQNRLLFELVQAMLQEQAFQVFANEAVPANDGGIALGEAYVAALRQLDQMGDASPSFDDNFCIGDG